MGLAGLVGLVVLTFIQACQATTYYVDSVGGNDSNAGTSSNAAWQTLSQINGNRYSAGDVLLLKNGSSWTGTMNPQGSGASGSPITLSNYGTNSALPLINGNGNTDALVLTNQQYWEINNLEVINPGADTTTERRGIHLCAANFGQVNHLYVSNCYVHNICGRVDTSNGDTVAKRTGGIIVEVITDSGANTWFHDIKIQACTIMSVTNQGIVACANRSGGSDYPGTAAWNNRSCSNVHIFNNTISDVCKNAMSIRYGDETCLVEHNLAHDTANATDGNMICTYGCRGTVFQFNEGYHNNGDGLHDGCLYDADLRSQNIVFQYSYSHDNSWGLFCHYASSDTNGNAFGNDTHIVVRYNISQNDRGDIFALSGDSGAVASEYIYNNTIYTPASLSPLFFDDRGAQHTYYVYNNIFYNLSTAAGYNFSSSDTRIFNYNVFYPNLPSNTPADANILVSNPLLVAAGTGGGVGGTNNFSTLAGYKLQTNSPCIDSGLTITTNLTGNNNAGGVDFFGVAVPQGFGTDRGASESSVAIFRPPPSAAPTILIVTTNSGQISLTWSAVATATTYNVKRSTTSGAETNLASTVNTNYTDTTVVNGATYYYVVSAINNGGEGPNSAEVTATPLQGSGLTVLVDFQGNTNDVTPSPNANGIYWNTVVPAQTGSGAVQLNGSKAPIALVDTTNANDGWTMAITNLVSFDASGSGPYSDYAGPYPAAVTNLYPGPGANFPNTALRSGMKINGSGSATPRGVSVTLSGLATNSTYNLLTYGGLNGTGYGPQTNTLTVGTSSSPASVSFNCLNNATTVVEWTNITPNASGRIAFTIIAQFVLNVATNTGVLNLLELNQNTQTNTPATLGGIAAGVIGGNTLTLNWTAGANVHLQRATNLIPPAVWTDVPNTTGQGSATVTMTNTRMFFRLMQP